MSRALLVIALCASCRHGFDDTPRDALEIDASTTAPPTYTSGTILRAIVQEGEGASRHIGWFDTSHADECSFVLDENGVTRCLPWRVSAGVQFADAACTVRLLNKFEIADAAVCPSAGLLGIVAFDAAGEARNRVVTVGAQFTGTLYQDTGSGCVVLSGNAGYNYFQGSPVAPDEFVAAHEELVPAGPVSYVRILADDGASQLDPDSLVDTATGARCSLYNPTWNTVECVPSELPFVNIQYADAACTERAFTIADPTVGPGSRVFVIDFGLCGETFTDAVAGSELTTYYNFSPAGCAAQSTSPSVRAFRIANETPFPGPRGTLAVPSGASRLASAYWQFETGHTLPAGFYDRTRGDKCQALTLHTTLTQKCAPIWGSSPIVYSDPGCATAVLGWPSCRGPWHGSWYPMAPGTFTCDYVAQFVYPYDVPDPGPHYAFEGTSCMPVDPSITVFTRTNDEYPAAEMATLTRRTE